MKSIRSPHIKSSFQPFLEGTIDKSNSCISIGNSEIFENVFLNSFPESIRILAKIKSISEFPDVNISARYKTFSNDDPKIMSFKIYEGSSIKMDNYVNEISLEFVDIIPDGFSNYTGVFDYLQKHPALFSKSFEIQKVSRSIDNFVIPSPKGSSIIHTKTKEHPFGGFFNPYDDISSIDQYSFVLGTGNKGIPYIEVLPSKSFNLFKELLHHKIQIDSITYKIKYVEQFKDLLQIVIYFSEI